MPTKKHVISLMVALALPVAGYTVPKVAATINPIHFLVNAVTHNIADSSLLITDTACVHDCVLKPSDVVKLNSADVLFYVNEELEPFIKKVRPTQGKRLVRLSDEVELLSERSPHRKRNAYMKDFHIWLSPENAGKMIRKISAVLSEEDPEHAAEYERNTDITLKQLDTMTEKIRDTLAPVRGKPYVAVHDTYQYFDQYFGLEFVASLSPGHTTSVTTKELSFTRKAIKQHGVKCIFTDLLDNKNYKLISERITIYTLDSLGLNVKQNNNGYFQLMENLALGFRTCLQQ